MGLFSMTRGYVVLVKYGKILDVAYSNSNSYFKGLGLELLEAYKNNELEEFLVLQDEYNFDNKCFFDKTWYSEKAYMKKFGSLDGWFAVDYTYIFDLTKNKLIIYYFGKKYLAFDLFNVDTLIYLFKNYVSISNNICYDEKELNYKYDRFKNTINRLIKEGNFTIEELSRLNYNEERIVVNCNHCIDFWTDEFTKSYKYFVEIENSNDFGRIVIINSSGKYNRFKKWNLYIQTSFSRKHIGLTFSSEKRAIKWLKEFVKNNINELKKFNEQEKYINLGKKQLDNMLVNDNIYNDFWKYWEGLNIKKYDNTFLKEGEIKNNFWRLIDLKVRGI